MSNHTVFLLHPIRIVFFFPLPPCSCPVHVLVPQPRSVPLWDTPRAPEQRAFVLSCVLFFEYLLLLLARGGRRGRGVALLDGQRRDGADDEEKPADDEGARALFIILFRLDRRRLLASRAAGFHRPTDHVHPFVRIQFVCARSPDLYREASGPCLFTHVFTQPS